MTRFILFLCLITAGFAADIQSTVNAMNYPLRRVMAPAQTYAGVLVDAQEVRVRTNPRGLIAGLTLGLTNVTLGTDLGSSSVAVHQYVVRLDTPERGRMAQLITVIQGGGSLIQPGTPVFLATESACNGTVFSVRLIPARAPEFYGTRGLEETRLAAQQTATP